MTINKLQYLILINSIGQGVGLSDLISTEYNKIEGSLTLQYRPPNAASLININLDSTCPDKEEVRAEKEIVCHDITVATQYSFSAEIELDPKICDTGNRDPIPVQFSIFGQENSKMLINIGN